MDVRMAVRGDDFVCLADEDGLNYSDYLLKSKYTAEEMVTLGVEDSDAKRLLVLNRLFRVGKAQTGQCLDLTQLETCTPHHQRVWMQRNTKTASTEREKLQDKLVIDVRKSPILKNEDTRNKLACMRFSQLAQDRSDLSERPRDLYYVPVKRVARYLVGKPNAAIRFRRQELV